jgi:hypothetical protein
MFGIRVGGIGCIFRMARHSGKRFLVAAVAILIVGSLFSAPAMLNLTGSSATAQSTTCTNTTVTTDSVLSVYWTPATSNLFCNLADLNAETVWGVEDNPNVLSDQDVYDLTSDPPCVPSSDPPVCEKADPQWPGLVEIDYNDQDGSDLQSILGNEYTEGGIPAIYWRPPDPVTLDQSSSDDNPHGDDVCSYVIPGDTNYGKKNPKFKKNGVPSANFQGYLEDLWTTLKNLFIPGTATPLPVILRIFPEMNGDWDWWGNDKGGSANGYCTVAEYKQMYQYAVNWLADNEQQAAGEPSQAPTSNAIMVWAPAGGSTGSFGCYSVSSYTSDCAPFYPGNGYVDVAGIDAYDHTTSEIMPDSSTVMGALAATVSFAASKSKMPAMIEGENQHAYEIQKYWTQYFCALAYDTTCSDQSSGNATLTALRWAMVWFDQPSQKVNFAPSPAYPGVPNLSQAGVTKPADFVTAIEKSYSGFRIGMSFQQGSANGDPWDCPELSCS